MVTGGLLGMLGALISVAFNATQLRLSGRIPSFGEMLAVDPGCGQPEALSRDVVVVETLGHVEDLLGPYSEISRQMVEGTRLRSRLAGTDVLGGIDRAESVSRASGGSETRGRCGQDHEASRAGSSGRPGCRGMPASEEPTARNAGPPGWCELKMLRQSRWRGLEL
jgi:hypothetical protein